MFIPIEEQSLTGFYIVATMRAEPARSGCAGSTDPGVRRLPETFCQRRVLRIFGEPLTSPLLLSAHKLGYRFLRGAEYPFKGVYHLPVVKP